MKTGYQIVARRPWIPDILYGLFVIASWTLAAAIGVVLPVVIWARTGTVPPDTRIPITGLVLWGWAVTGFVWAVGRTTSTADAPTEPLTTEQFNSLLAANYDATAGTVDTPVGAGKLVMWDPASRMAYVEFDYEHVVAIAGADCRIRMEGVAPGAASS
jgi:hypothetical protein